MYLFGGAPGPSRCSGPGSGYPGLRFRCGAAHSSRWSLPSYPLATLTLGPPTASSATSPRLQLRTSRRQAALPPPANHRSGPGRRSAPSLPCSAGVRAAFFRPNPCYTASAPPLHIVPALSPPHRNISYNSASSHNQPHRSPAAQGPKSPAPRVCSPESRCRPQAEKARRLRCKACVQATQAQKQGTLRGASIGEAPKPP